MRLCMKNLKAALLVKVSCLRAERSRYLERAKESEAMGAKSTSFWCLDMANEFVFKIKKLIRLFRIYCDCKAEQSHYLSKHKVSGLKTYSLLAWSNRGYANQWKYKLLCAMK